MLLLILLMLMPLSATLDQEQARLQAYLHEIPFMAESSYAQKQSALLENADKALQLLQTRPLESFPRASGRENVYFIEDLGVFKTEATRDFEILTWELACLFGIEEAFTPAVKLTLGGVEGELQAYCPNDLTKAQSYDERMYQHVTCESFAKCALGVLLFALRDMHNENCAYKTLREGRLEMRFFDTLIAFAQNDFIAEGLGSPYPLLTTPYHWIGWDFPQAERAPPKKLKPLLNSFPERVEALKLYLAHPLTPYRLDAAQMESLIQRALLLHRLAESAPKKWLLAIQPQYREVEKKLSFFIPQHKTNWLLFRLQWNPPMVYGLMSESDQAAFREWIEHM